MIMFMHMEYSLAAQTAFYIGASQYKKAVWDARLSHVEYCVFSFYCIELLIVTPRIYTEFFHPKLGKGGRLISMILNHNK